MAEGESWLLVEDVARRYRVAPYTVRTWLREGALRGGVVGGRWVTTWDALFLFEARLTPPPPGPQREAAKQPLLTIDDLAAHLRISADAAQRRCRSGAIAARKIRKSWYADQQALRDHDRACLPEFVSRPDAGNAP